MILSIYDFAIIGLYLVVTIGIGLHLKKKAQGDKGSYLLGGNRIPWYMLSLSNASGMFDISGTMWMVTILFVYGLKSIWLPWLWPVFNQVFLMVYLSAWLRKSRVTTGAEWITTRFGTDNGAKLSHSIVVVFAIINCLGFMAYGFVGLGKFMEIFIPFEYVQPYLPFVVSPEFVPHLYGITFTLFAVFYALIGGMLSIVWTDVIQYVIMTVAAVIVAGIAMSHLSEGTLNVPEGWLSPLFNQKLNLNWDQIIPEVNSKISSDGYNLFGLLFMMMLFKGFLVSAAGPAPNFDMQKILSAKTPKEGALMSGLVSVILLPTRYLLITGLTVLGILYYDKLDLMVAGQIDFEQILPSTINLFVPIGLMGLLLAGLLAAFMSTFAGTLNAAQAYVVNDIYLKYINPNLENSQIKYVNYISGLLIVGISIAIGVLVKDVNSILQWLVSGLWGGYIASNVLKWYWWRFNGYGYFWGMISGLIPALIMPSILPGLFPEVSESIILLYFFPVLLVISMIGCLAGTYATQPTSFAVLSNFYKNVRPWGFWKPIYQIASGKDETIKPNKNFGRDAFNIVVGIVWQTSLPTIPIFLVLGEFEKLFISISIALFTTVILYKSWYLKLNEGETDKKQQTPQKMRSKLNFVEKQKLK
jgi:Na+/proline symporter